MPPGASQSISTTAGHGPVTGNNFNAVRLLFALMVVAYHLTVLPGLAGWKAAESLLSLGAEIGVQGFFVLSGYLVYGSLVRSDSFPIYAEKRARRLFPGYATVVVSCVLAALAFSEKARADLAGVFHYFIGNITFFNFLQPNLPGLFEANRFTEVNGALWTLKIEVMFYALLPALAWLLGIAGKYRWAAVAAIYAGAEAWRIGFAEAGHANESSPLLELSRQLPGQLSFFITGMAFAMLELARRRLNEVGLVGLSLFVLSLLAPWSAPLRAIGLGALAIWVAIAAPRLPDAARFGDLSYGAYIAHFPIIQTIVALGLFAAIPWLGLAASIILIIAASLLLWHFVERPALRPDSAYKAASIV